MSQTPTRAAILEALCASEPDRKCETVWRLSQGLAVEISGAFGPGDIPGRPQRPRLVSPQKVKKRGLGSPQGRAALIHAVAHIEFNAINLALDAAWRFEQLPEKFYRDWLGVAAEEARHFQMLCRRLNTLGYAYGDFPAHNGLWEAAEKTGHDVLIRMALVPRVLEARGLDVTPGMIDRLNAAGDAQTVSILRIILQEEQRHVAIGSEWFSYFCRQRARAPQATFQELLRQYNMRIHPPVNAAARRNAGFSDQELAELIGPAADQAQSSTSS
ncbi:MAG: ferritin-like domain-containing protein [Panacagrimonas sp.]